MTISELSKLWQKCAHLLREQLTPSVYNTWFASLDAVSYENKVLVLRVKSQFVAEYIEENYIRELGRAIRSVFGDDTRLAYRVLVDSTTGSSATYASQQAERPQVRFASESTDAVIWDSQLNQQYTFTTFILGKTNKLARAAGLAIAKEPGRTVFNPLFIYGGSGVGKTHLANAIGNEIAKLFPLHRVLYVSANTFKLQYQEAVREKKVPEFLVFYQNVDVLIMDDIQFFEGLKGTQDTFFHIFDYLHQSQKQLILTSDRPPLELQDVEERLLTRFKWGLSVEIERPDLNLRKAILMDKVQRDGLPLTEEIVDYIAVRACDNIRDIEGILASLMAYATLTECDIDLHLVQTVLSHVVKQEAKEVVFADVLGAVCERMSINERAILSRTRSQDVVRARYMIVYLAKRLTDRTLAEIGNHIGHRSHSTVLHAYNSVLQQMETDTQLRNDLRILEAELKK